MKEWNKLFLSSGALFFAALLVLLLLFSIQGCSPQSQSRASRDSKLGPDAPLKDTVVRAPALLQLEELVILPVVFEGQARSAQTVAYDSRFKRKLNSISGIEARTRDEVPSISSSKYELHTVFYLLEERIGSRIGSSEPAKVHFEFEVLGPMENGRKSTVWKGSFLSKEQPLTDNLFGVGRRAKVVSDLGPGYHSANELVDYGFSQVARRLYEIRSKALLR